MCVFNLKIYVIHQPWKTLICCLFKYFLFTILSKLYIAGMPSDTLDLLCLSSVSVNLFIFSISLSLCAHCMLVNLLIRNYLLAMDFKNVIFKIYFLLPSNSMCLVSGGTGKRRSCIISFHHVAGTRPSFA